MYFIVTNLSLFIFSYFTYVTYSVISLSVDNIFNRLLYIFYFILKKANTARSKQSREDTIIEPPRKK